jgi:hypothetical protein
MPGYDECCFYESLEDEKIVRPRTLDVNQLKILPERDIGLQSTAQCEVKTNGSKRRCKAKSGSDTRFEVSSLE